MAQSGATLVQYLWFLQSRSTRMDVSCQSKTTLNCPARTPAQPISSGSSWMTLPRLWVFEIQVQELSVIGIVPVPLLLYYNQLSFSVQCPKFNFKRKPIQKCCGYGAGQGCGAVGGNAGLHPPKVYPRSIYQWGAISIRQV